MELDKSEGLRHRISPITQALPDSLREYFANRHTVKELAIGRSDTFDSSLAHMLANTDEAGRLGLLNGLINVAGSDAIDWGQDERDASVTIFGKLCEQIVNDEARPINKLDVVTNYVGAIKSLPPQDDYFGVPHTMYELGQTISSCVGYANTAADAYRINMEVRDAWADCLLNVSNGEFEFKEQSKELVESLSANFIKVPVQAHGENNEKWGWARSKPDMDAATEKIHDTYLDVVRKEKSFRRFLAIHAPEFQDNLKRHGISIAEFWNVSDPVQVINSLQAVTVDERFSSLQDMLNGELIENCGLDLAAFTSDNNLAALYADQIVSSIKKIRANITSGLRDPYDVYDRIAEQSRQAVNATRKSKKLKPVRGFLKDLGLSADMDVHELVRFFASSEAHEQIIGQLHARNQRIIDLDKALGDILPPEAHKHLSFMRRDESDMYAADETLDCTAYHYQNGFNAWTVPNWLAEPAFTMAYLSNGRHRVAKLGILLAQDENQPRLVIDSIETNKHLKGEDANEALIVILEGIKELQTWADSRNLGDVFFCTYTNSSELAMELPVRRADDKPRQLMIINGGGRDELWRTLQESEGELRPSYWQSQGAGEDEALQPIDPDYDYEVERRDEILADLEQVLVSGSSPEMVEYGRTGDINGVVVSYIAKNMPTLYSVFGHNLDLYKNLYESKELALGEIIDHQRKELKLTEYVLGGVIGLGEIDSRLASLDQGWKKGRAKWIRDNVRIQNYDVLRNEKDATRLRYETEKADVFFATLAAVGRHGSLEEALRLIFGMNVGLSADVSNAVLSRDLKVIDR